MSTPNSQKPLSLTSGTTGYTFLTDANGHQITELYQDLHDTAIRICSAVPDPSQWPNFIIYLVASLENQKADHPCIESSLDNVCRLIVKRMNTGKWEL